MSTKEIDSFKDLWEGGYYEGNPLDPHALSLYSMHDWARGFVNQVEVAREKGIGGQEIGSLSAIYVAYLMCIRGQVAGKYVLEIGPGRGAWSRCILTEGAQHLYALDALSAKHNGFFEYLTQNHFSADRVTYYQVQDLSCQHVPNGCIDFFFSFGVFCHISRTATTEYFNSIYTKMRPGGDGYVMINDIEKFRSAMGQDSIFPSPNGILDDETPSPGRWYHLGIDWFCNMMAEIGFVIRCRDIGCNVRDPVVHFSR